jgi:hypothetical protein
MKRRLIALAPWVLLVLLIVAWGAALWFDRASAEVTSALDKLWAVSFFAFPAVGVFLARRFPSNAVGWLFIIGPLFVGAGVALQELADVNDLSGLVTLSEVVFDAGLLTLFSSLTVFPEGRYERRWLIWVHIVLLVVLGMVAGSYLALVALLALVPLVIRLIRGNATVRRQIVGPFLVVLVGVLALMAVNVFFGDSPVLAQTLTTAFTLLLTIGVPVSIAVAITRYRLYEIDRIVSRTVTYTLVITLLAGVYLAGITVLTVFLSTDSPLAVAGSTLAAAALFNPVRKRVQAWVDRRFNRSRYDTEKVMEVFTDSLRDEVDGDEMVRGWIGVVSETMQPVAAGVWVREDR